MKFNELYKHFKTIEYKKNNIIFHEGEKCQNICYINYGSVTISTITSMEKEEIIQIAQKIDTYETSILPYEDCCTVFVPKEPKTRPKVEACEQEEAKLDLPTLIASAVENTERIIVYGKDKPERRYTGAETALESAAE